jgi:hypothetical protein
VKAAVVFALLVAATGTSRGDREASFEIDAGVQRFDGEYGPEGGFTAGYRSNPQRAFGLRVFVFRVGQQVNQQGGIIPGFSAMALGPAWRFDVPSTPLWLAAAPTLVIVQSGDIGFGGLALEARIGVSFFRIEKQAFLFALSGRAFAGEGGNALQASATIGYVVN